MLKLANSALKPPDSLAGGGEVGLQLLEYGAGMFGQVRQLPQGPGQSHVTDGDQILEKQALLVRDLIPAQQLGFHYSFGKRHVGSDRGINPTKKWLKSEQKAVLSPQTPAPLSANSASAASAGAPHPCIGHGGVWCSWLRRRVICRPNSAAACCCAPGSKLEVVFKKRWRGNPGADQRETGSGVSAVSRIQDEVA